MGRTRRIKFMGSSRRNIRDPRYRPSSPSHSFVSRIVAYCGRRFRCGRVGSTAGGHDLFSLRRPSCRTAAASRSVFEHCEDQRAVAVAFLIAFLAAVQSLLSAIVADRMIGGSHRSNAELLAQGAANIVSPLFGGTSRNGRDRKDRDERPRWRTHPGCGYCACRCDPSAGPRCRAARRVSHHAGARWAPNRDSVADERTGAIVRAHEVCSAADRALFFMTMILTVVSNLTIAIAVGTGAGLGFRLLRRNVGPAA